MVDSTVAADSKDEPSDTYLGDRISEAIAGWATPILLLSGVALITCSFVFRGSASVSAPGIVIGSSLLAISVLLVRLEGTVEVGPSGMKVNIGPLLRKARRDTDLKPSQKEEVVERATEIIAESPQFVTRFMRRFGDVTTTAYNEARSEYMILEDRVDEWLSGEGWIVERGSVDSGFDFVAQKSNETMLVEAKLSSSHLGSDFISTIDSRAARWRQGRPDSLVTVSIFVLAPRLSPTALEAARNAGIQVYLDMGVGFTRLEL